MSKKIFIIGNSANVYALAKKLSDGNEIFVAPGSDAIKEFATCVDIREDSALELLEFAMENGIDLTIPFSEKSLKSNITTIFNNNNLQIFAPSTQTANVIFDKALVKKMLYKLRIPTPKFGIFEKQNMAQDYIKSYKQPFVIKTNEPSSAVVLTSPLAAKTILNSYYSQKNQKVIIEDYIWGTSFSFYAITDGYKALPLGSSIVYKHSLDGGGGQLTTGMGACSPNYKLSFQNEEFLMNDVIYPIIEYFERENEPYLGIISVNAILTEDGNIQVLGLNSILNDCDADAVLSLVDENLVDLMEKCILGSFSDDVDYIKQKDLSATSIVLVCKNAQNNQNVIENIDSLDDETMYSIYPNVNKNKYLEFEANQGPVMVLSSIARTYNTTVTDIKNLKIPLETSANLIFLFSISFSIVVYLTIGPAIS